MPTAKSHLAQDVKDFILRNRLRYCVEPFMARAIALEVTSAAIPGGTDTNIIAINTGAGNTFEFTYVGGASDAFMPVLGSEGGYDWQFDKDTNAEGVTINFGGTIPGHPRSYTPLGLSSGKASDEFFARLLVNCEDASGLNAWFGLMDSAAVPVGVTDFTNAVGIRVLGDSSSTTAAVTLETNIGNSGSTDIVSTDPSVTLEEPTEIELELRVLQGGKVFWLVNGVQYTPTSGTTTYSGTPTLIPVAQLLQTTDITSRLNTRAFECGLIEDRYPGTLRALLTTFGVAAST